MNTYEVTLSGATFNVSAVDESEAIMKARQFSPGDHNTCKHPQVRLLEADLIAMPDRIAVLEELSSLIDQGEQPSSASVDQSVLADDQSESQNAGDDGKSEQDDAGQQSQVEDESQNA